MEAAVMIVMGVTGAGKTTIGVRLARSLAWAFYDADDFHSAENRRKMRAGVALSDQDRVPWLAALRRLIDARLKACEVQRIGSVLACSALKRSYRARLIADGRVKLIYLRADFATVRARLARRRRHFMNPTLLRSQFDALEEPRKAIIVDAARPPREMVADLLAALNE